MRFAIAFASRFIPRHHLQRFSGFMLKIIGLAYLGNKFEDPISGKKYRKLLPYGRIHTRANALAPHSMSLERHRLLWLYLKQKTNFFRVPNKVLHIAPEYCFIGRFSKMKNLDYITADLNSPWAKVKLDVQDMPFDDNVFDVILCNHVLEHVPSDRLAIGELFRVMKPGGFGIFQVPLDTNLSETLEDGSINTPELRELHYGQRDHLRLYGNDYSERLRKSGFLVTEDNFVQTLSKDLVTRYALSDAEVIYLCVKPLTEQQ
ncbi:MAG: SAM-dependent methyltransferase [Bacteroidetes bacterium HGW-Bacteroidetes-15]|nr:MAG: SAM-dependent methyltransferase [Bacteroidetes bacterium HGW-Bacteroidetes-15]